MERMVEREQRRTLGRAIECQGAGSAWLCNRERAIEQRRERTIVEIGIHRGERRAELVADHAAIVAEPNASAATASTTRG